MKKICCICGKKFNTFGNNPEPLMPLEDNGKENRCCDSCDWKYIVPVRLLHRRVFKAAKEGINLFEMPAKPSFNGMKYRSQ